MLNPRASHDAWKELRDGSTVWSKGERVSTGQWFGVTDASEVLQADWNMKGVLCLNMCIMAGLMDNSSFNSIANVFKNLKEASEQAQESVKDDRTVAAGKREVSAMRDACKSALILSTALLSDADFRRRERIILAVIRYIRAER